MNVLLADIQAELLTSTEAEVRALGAEALFVPTDVSRKADMENLARESYERFGAVDLLVNNAGVSQPATVLNGSVDDWNWLMAVNFFGMLYGLRAFAPRMMEQNTAGYIVKVASMAGVVEAIDAYGVSKHAAVALTEPLNHELADRAPQIKVSVFLPGLINTELYRGEESRPARFRKNTPRTQSADDHTEIKRFFLKYGFAIEDAVSVLFDGIAQEKLYIGPVELQRQSPQILDAILQRTENIRHCLNPSHPRDLGPTNPA